MKNKIFSATLSNIKFFTVVIVFMTAFSLRWYLFDFLRCFDVDSVINNHNLVIENITYETAGEQAYFYPPNFYYLQKIFSNVIYFKLVSVTVSALSIILFFYITTKITNLLIGLVAVFLMSVNIPHIFMASNTYPEIFLGFFVSLVVLMSLFFQKKYRFIYGLLVGLFLFISSFIRQSVLFYLFSYPFLYSSFYLKNSFKNCIRLFVIPLLSIAVCVFIMKNVSHFDYTSNPELNLMRETSKSINMHNNKDSLVYRENCNLSDKMDKNKQTGTIFLDKIVDAMRDMLPIFYKNNPVIWIISVLNYLFILLFLVLGFFMTIKVKLFMPLHGMLIMGVVSTLLKGYDVFFITSLIPLCCVYCAVGICFAVKKVMKMIFGATLLLSDDWRYNRVTI